MVNTVGADSTVMLKTAVVKTAVGAVLSVTLTRKPVVPVVVGAPEMTPAADRLKPAGSVEGPGRVQVYGAFPPVAASAVA
jgi:hypothetical protein